MNRSKKKYRDSAPITWDSLSEDSRKTILLKAGETKLQSSFWSGFKWYELPEFLKPFVVGVMIPQHPQGRKGPPQLLRYLPGRVDARVGKY